MRGRLARREPAQIYVWTAVLLAFLLAFAGLVVDAGRLFLERASLQRLADAAARAGAMQLDEAALRAAPDACPRLNPVAAREAASRYLAGRSELSGWVDATAEAVGVALRARSRPTLLGLFGAGSIEVTARSVASPRTGVAAPRPECGR